MFSEYQITFLVLFLIGSFVLLVIYLARASKNLRVKKICQEITKLFLAGKITDEERESFFDKFED